MGSHLPGVGRQTVELSTDSSAFDDRRGGPPRRYHQPGDDAGQTTTETKIALAKRKRLPRMTVASGARATTKPWGTTRGCDRD